MTTNQSEQAQIHSFDNVEKVIADSLRFKRKLAIGGDAYTSLRLAKTVQQIWDVGGVAATGGAAAASTTVAGTFFATSGWMASIGLGAAAVTPVGWIIGAAVASGGAYYGVTRLFQKYGDSRVETIPKFINTPIDLLGASMLDLLGAFAIKVAMIDGEIVEQEIEVIQQYFINEWGYDRDYVENAVELLKENSNRNRITEMVKVFAGFARSNPDCNFDAIQKELVSLLTTIAEADGKIDEREELAIEKIAQTLSNEASIITAVGSVVATPARAGSWVAQKIFRRIR
jgi:uncharacterized tellurite resistance protein B-like protein